MKHATFYYYHSLMTPPYRERMETADPPPSTSNQEAHCQPSILWMNLSSKIRNQLNAYTKAMLQASSADVGKLQSSAVELTSIASILFVQRLLDQTIKEASINPSPELSSSSSSPPSIHTNTLTVRHLQETIQNHADQFAVLNDVVEEWNELADEEKQKHTAAATTNHQKRASSILTEGLFPRKKKPKRAASAQPQSSKTASLQRKQNNKHLPVNDELQQALKVIEKNVDTKTTTQLISSTGRKIILDDEDYDDDDDDEQK
jgi:hypothetical protein